MPYNDDPKTYKAGEALLVNRRVKVESGTVTDPPEVVYADAGEQHIGVTMIGADDGDMITVRPINYNGTYQVVAADAFAVGATLYGAADGKVSDTSSGTAIGIAITVASGDGIVAEMQQFVIASTTAANVSIADSGGFTTAATVEAAIQEIYQDILSVQQFINIPIMTLREATNFDVGAITANGGVLASDTTPVLSAINDATDGCQRVSWVASNNDQVIAQVALPPDLDVTADLVLHCRIASGGTTDAVGFTVDSFFNEGDTKVVDTTTTNQTATYAEKIATIAASDVPSGAQTLTIGLTPAAHTTDTCNLTALWLEYTAALKTS